MKRKIFLLMIVLLSILMLSCKNKNNDDFKNGMLYGVDLDSQNEIVQTFKNIYSGRFSSIYFIKSRFK